MEFCIEHARDMCGKCTKNLVFHTRNVWYSRKNNSIIACMNDREPTANAFRELRIIKFIDANKMLIRCFMYQCDHGLLSDIFSGYLQYVCKVHDHNTIKLWVSRQPYENRSGAYLINDFSILIQMWWKFHSLLIQVAVKWSLWYLVHGITAVLSWHVQNYHKTSNISRTIVGNKIVDHSDLIPGFNWLGKDHCQMKRETFKVWDFVPYIRDLTVCSDMMPYNGVALKPILHQIWITMEKFLVKWAPAPDMYLVLRTSQLLNLNFD